MEIFNITLIVVLPIATLIIAYFGAIVPYAKGEVKLHKRFPFVTKKVSDLGKARKPKGFSKKTPDLQIRNDLPLPQRLLTLIWNYPLAGGNHTSWAVKEGEVLRGDLISASQRPGLGVAIFSTELALKAFCSFATRRINGCINWGLSRTQQDPPYLLLVEGTEPITSKMEIKTDFRHTLALSIILARFGQHLIHLEHYIQLTLEQQRDDGGWSPGEGILISEIFTVLYAAELLTLCSHIKEIPKETRRKAVLSRNKAIDWLIKNTDGNKLWKGDVLEYSWDPLLSTAWVLRRLLPFKEISSGAWLYCSNQAMHSMIQGALNPTIWLTSTHLQRLRVEARIASAATIATRSLGLDAIVSEKVMSYLKDWRIRTEKALSEITDKQLDLSTALFLVDALIDPLKLKEWASRVLKMSTTNMVI